MHDKHPLFALGDIYSTPGALAALEEAKSTALDLIARHVTGDWSEMVEEDLAGQRTSDS